MSPLPPCALPDPGESGKAVIADCRHPSHMVDDLERIPAIGSLERVATITDDREAGRYGLLVIAKNIPDGPRFSEQTDLIKSSGASYDSGSRTWWLWLEQAVVGDEPGINDLFAAAREYGTSVTLQRR